MAIATVSLPPPDFVARLPAQHQRLRFGNLELSSRFLLSPLAGYTNLPYRLAVRELGGLGLATSDLVNARALLQFSRKTMELISTSAADRPVAMQIYGAQVEEMRAAAQWLEQYGVSSIDFPAYLVNAGLGSKLSTWLTPPQRKIQITDLAFATRCGSWLVEESAATAAPSRNSIEPSARPVKPIPVATRKERRETPGQRRSSGDSDADMAIPPMRGQPRRFRTPHSTDRDELVMI